MRELNIMEATVLTSPNPLTLICSKKEDGSTNLAPICFVSYLSFNPPMVGFATGKQSHTGKQVRETGKVIVTVPGESLAQAVMACGASTGAKTDKVAANNIEMMAVEGSDIQIPADTRLAMVATLQQSVEVGVHSAAVGGSWRPYPALLPCGQVPGRRGEVGPVCLVRLQECCPGGRRLNLKTERRRQRWLSVSKTVFRT